MTRRFLFLTSSARMSGNSECLARLAAGPLGGTARWIDLAALELPPFRDLRPAALPPDGVLAPLAEAILQATDIVLVAPVYWYALPAPAKLLLDHWSGWLDVDGMDFAPRMKGKTLWLVTVRADSAPAAAAPVEAMVRQTAAWLGMDFGGALHGIGDEPGDVLADTDAMARARTFFAAASVPDHGGA